MDDLIAEFLAEANEDLQAIDGKLVKLESNPKQIELVDDIFRVIHSIKGACGFFELNDLSSISHASEDILAKLRTKELVADKQVISIILESIDKIKAILLYVEKNGKEPKKDYSNLLQKISDVTQGKQSTNLSKNVEREEVDENLLPERNSPKSIRVNVEALEELMQDATELVLNRNKLIHIAQEFSNSELSEALDKLDDITSKLQDSVIDARLQPIGYAWNQLPRVVRDLASSLDKKVKLIMRGESTQLDKQLIEAIKDPMVHMLRNSIDHGIESPAERVKVGKPEEGTITLTARHSNGQVIIDVADDGRGVDVTEVRAKILEKNIADKDKIASLSDEEVIQYIFHPGFSTANNVTNISGRGVGMNVLKKNIQNLHGNINIVSQEGIGMTITVVIPLTLAITSVLLMDVAGVKFAIPKVNVKEIVSIDSNLASDLNVKYSNNQLQLRDINIPCILLSKLLKLPKRSPNFVIVCKIEDQNYGLAVDKVCSLEEVVLKPLSKIVELAEVYMGNALLGDDEIILLLNPSQIMKYCSSSPVSEVVKLKTVVENTSSFLLFEVGGECKAIALEKIIKVEVLSEDKSYNFKGKRKIKYNNGMIPLIFIDKKTELLAKDRLLCLIIKINDQIIAISVDKIVRVVDLDEQYTANTMLVLDENKVEIINIEKIIESYNG